MKLSGRDCEFMKKRMGIILFILIFVLSCKGKSVQSVGEAEDPLEQDLGEIKAFDPAPFRMGQGPPTTLPESNAPRRPSSGIRPPRVVLIGFEGLIWDLLNHAIDTGQARNLTEFLARGVRARMLTGLDPGEYADPENCWAIALSGRQNLRVKPSSGKGFPPELLPQSVRMIWQMLPAKRFAFLDSPFVSAGSPNEVSYFSKHIIDSGREAWPTGAFETETTFDNAGVKFHILNEKDFDFAVMAIDELDKTQHRVLLGYVVESVRGNEEMTIKEGFQTIFEENSGELAALLRDFDKMVGFINENHRSDIVIIFSLHGQAIAPYEFRLFATQEFYKRASIFSETDEFGEKVRLIFKNHEIPGLKENRSRAIDVLFNKANKQDLKAKLSYPRFVFDFNPISLDKALIAGLVGELEASLSECRFNGMKLWRIEVEQDNSMTIEPSRKFLSALPFSDPLMFNCGLVVNRVQDRHPGSIPGVFMAAGPGIPDGMLINDVRLIDILPTVLNAAGVAGLKGFEGSNLFATHFDALHH